MVRLTCLPEGIANAQSGMLIPEVETVEGIPLGLYIDAVQFPTHSVQVIRTRIVANGKVNIRSIVNHQPVSNPVWHHAHPPMRLYATTLQPHALFGGTYGASLQGWVRVRNMLKRRIFHSRRVRSLDQECYPWDQIWDLKWEQTTYLNYIVLVAQRILDTRFHLRS